MAKKIYIGNMLQEMQSAIADLQSDMATMSSDMAGMVSQLTDISHNTVQSINSLKVVSGNDKAVALTDVSQSKIIDFSSTGALLAITKPEFKVFCDGIVKVTLDLACSAASAAGQTASFKLQGIIGGAVVANGDFVVSDPFASASYNAVAVTNVTVDIPVSFGDVVQVGVFAKGSKTGGNTSGKDWILSNIMASYSLTNIISDGAIVET